MTVHRYTSAVFPDADPPVIALHDGQIPRHYVTTQNRVRMLTGEDKVDLQGPWSPCPDHDRIMFCPPEVYVTCRAPDWQHMTQAARVTEAKLRGLFLPNLPLLITVREFWTFQVCSRGGLVGYALLSITQEESHDCIVAAA